MKTLLLTHPLPAKTFADAVHAGDALARERARVRVLEYNEDDVRATWHLRRWLRTQD